MARLTEKQAAFVREYLIDLNAAQAAIRAGYSAKTAKQMGFENLQKPQVAEAVQKAMDERSKRTEITADNVINELAKIAFSDMRRIAVWGPRGVTFKASDDLAPEDAAAVAEIGETVTQHGGSQRVKLHDKLQALQLLGKHLKLFPDRHEHTGADGGPIRSEATLHTAGMSDEELRELAGEVED